MNTVRLLHLSDLHLAGRTYVPLRGRLWLEHWLSLSPIFLYAARHLADAAALTAQALVRRGLDAILVSGDLATTGLRRDLATAREFVTSEPRGPGEFRNRHNRPTLQAAGVPILLLPGNHDRYRPLAGLPGGTEFDRVFEDHWRAGQGVQTQALGDRLGIVSCDLTLASTDLSPFDVLGKGRAYPDRIRELVEQTERLRAEDPERAVLWMIHFPPRFKDLPPFLGLMEEERLVAAAEAARVSHLLCGHTHRCDYYCLDEGDRVFVHCAGSTLQESRTPDEENTMHWLELETDRGRITRFEHRKLVYDPALGIFG